VIAGYAVSLGDPTAVQTALALRQAIWRKSDPQWPGVRDTGDPVQRPRCGFHQRPHRPGLHRPQRSAKGTAVRPWLTVILDDHSRVIAGYAVFLGDPTAAQTALALRQAISRKSDPQWPVCGIPATLYSDHGGFHQRPPDAGLRRP